MPNFIRETIMHRLKLKNQQNYGSDMPKCHERNFKDAVGLRAKKKKKQGKEEGEIVAAS